MTSAEIRTRFLKFFESRNHRVVRSSSLVPAQDPTLLFSNAGMNQFKDVFLGREKRDYVRACSSQKCVRAGGKHNDLEQVGRTTRHHTFFEMLGNFSFGDYFKKEAIPWAWELITKEFAIPRKNLYVTVFLGSGSGPDDHDLIPHDDETHHLWVAQGVGKDRIFELGLKDNFWQMGDTGPCGPCSEIHYDLGPRASEQSHADCKFPCDCGRFVEIWNLVFMQYSRYCRYERDGYPAQWGEQARADHKHSDDRYACLALDLLPKPSIDTGAGLERLAAVLQGKLSNFDTDLFKPLLEEAAGLANVEYGTNHDTDVSLRIIADHARAATFLISDGVVPSNEGRGYVLRLILRRALYHGQTLGLNEPFLYKISGEVVDLMKDAYPELAESAHHVAKTIKIEEERYAHTTRRGLEELEVASTITTSTGERLPFRARIAHRQDRARSLAEQYPGVVEIPIGEVVEIPKGEVWEVPGSELFKLHDTFGLRPDFVDDIVKTHGGTIDREGYEVEMAKQRERARASWKIAQKEVAGAAYLELAEKGETVFDGHKQTTSPNCRIVALFQARQAVSEAKPSQQVQVVLDRTPFYAEAGGQVGDTGRFLAPGSEVELAHVRDTFYPVIGIAAHEATTRQPLRIGDLVTAVVDAARRDATRRNHTATHLLHAALRTTLGTHVKQSGSLVAPDRLRFDFSHYAALSDQDVLDIEDLVNQHVLANQFVQTDTMDLDSAVNSGATALFGEKYSDQVRVVSINDFSKELCGGTHVHRTGDIGLFKIISEGSVAAGIRRIEALTGQNIVEHIRGVDQRLPILGRALQGKGGFYSLERNADPIQSKFDELIIEAARVAESEKKLRKELEAQQMKRAAEQADRLIKGLEVGVADSAADSWKDNVVHVVKGIQVISERVEVTDRAAMRQMIDTLRPKLKSGVIVLGTSTADGNVALIAAVTKDLTGRLDAGKIVKAAAAMVEGSGGGRKDLAEAGGKNPDKLGECLRAVPSLIEKML